MPETLEAFLDEWRARPANTALIEARRELRLFGLPFEVVLIRNRAARPGVPEPGRPAFAPDRGMRIRAEEALWSDQDLVLTPNRFPFFERQLCAWPRQGRQREHSEIFLERLAGIAARIRGTALLNLIGSSASIPLAHAHLVLEESRVTSALPLVEVAELEDARLCATDPSGSFPLLWISVEADRARRRAELARKLLDLRATPAANLMIQGRRIWIVPRREEVPAPWFPHALGCGELWGRFVHLDEDRFRTARAEDLERALVLATVPCEARQIEALGEAVLQP